VIARHLFSIEKLRQSRERTAAAALGAARAAGQGALNAVATFENQLTSQGTSQLRLEASLYENALANPMTDQQLSQMLQRIQRGSLQIDQMGRRLVQLKDEAAKAVAGAEAARVRHAASFRSCRKWKKLKEHILVRASLDDMHREEISIDDAIRLIEMDNRRC
jgi:hypothetical protein